MSAASTAAARAVWSNNEARTVGRAVIGPPNWWRPAA
ncbi:hypothetical protein SMALA_8471 [Streptomyces malaysiensis subsp. malaysiensis]|nr:hypothetical protein SMALA_8471 [Streptomyces malaysiensis]